MAALLYICGFVRHTIFLYCINMDYYTHDLRNLTGRHPTIFLGGLSDFIIFRLVYKLGLCDDGGYKL